MSRKGGGWQADNSSIYDSILYPLAKAKDYQWKSISEPDEYQDNEPPWAAPAPYIAYLIPIIVTSGPVYTVDALSDEAEVSKVKWTRLEREFRSRDRASYLSADLVSFPHLEDYVEKRLLYLIDRTRKALKANSKMYDPEWLLANYGRPNDMGTFERWRAFTESRNQPAARSLRNRKGNPPNHANPEI
jgi:hypothetical protein